MNPHGFHRIHQVAGMAAVPNILNDPPCRSDGTEIIEELLRSGNVRIERIISNGQVSPAGFWYDQSENEWVVLLQGEAAIAFADGTETRLKKGDTLFLPAHRQHRVTHTSVEPPCTWLAVFWNP